MEVNRTFAVQDLYQIFDLQAEGRNLAPGDKALLLDAVYQNLQSAEMVLPSNLEILVSEECNLRCDYCFEPDKKPRIMSSEVGIQSVDFLLRECGNNRNLGILFFGGEPLLAFPTIRAIVEYANKVVPEANRTISYTMTTNGTLFDEEMAEFCLASKIGLLLSIDGLPEVHDAHRKTRDGKGSYALIEKNLPVIFKYLGKPQVRVTPFPDTAHRLVEGIEHLLDLGFDNFIIGAAHGIEWPDAEWDVFDKAMQQVIEMAFSDRSLVPRFRIEVISGPPIRVGWGCRAGTGYITVGTDGRLGPCSLVMSTPGLADQYVLGHVTEGFSNKIARQEFCLLQAHRLEKCLQCELTQWCCGGCPGNNYKATGSILHPDVHSCKALKSQLAHQKLWHYCEQKYGHIKVWQLSGDS